MSKISHIATVASRLVQKRMYSLMGILNRQLQPQIKYCIKKGYHHASAAAKFDDTANTDEWQKEVYEYAVTCMQQDKFNNVIDLGCGSAHKLIHLLGAYNTTGVEVEPTYSWLRSRYPERNWLLFDKTDPSMLQTDLVICSDVIEHISDPDELMDFISMIRFELLIISTPERDAVAGRNDYGPPENTAHFREWNAEEFITYASRWFNIIDQRIFSSKSTTQILVCKKK